VVSIGVGCLHFKGISRRLMDMIQRIIDPGVAGQVKDKVTNKPLGYWVSVLVV
jgi:hypothetical protein